MAALISAVIWKHERSEVQGWRRSPRPLINSHWIERCWKGKETYTSPNGDKPHFSCNFLKEKDQQKKSRSLVRRAYCPGGVSAPRRGRRSSVRRLPLSHKSALEGIFLISVHGIFLQWQGTCSLTFTWHTAPISKAGNVAGCALSHHEGKCPSIHQTVRDPLSQAPPTNLRTNVQKGVEVLVATKPSAQPWWQSIS